MVRTIARKPVLHAHSGIGPHSGVLLGAAGSIITNVDFRVTVRLAWVAYVIATSSLAIAVVARGAQGKSAATVCLVIAVAPFVALTIASRSEKSTLSKCLFALFVSSTAIGASIGYACRTLLQPGSLLLGLTLSWALISLLTGAGGLYLLSKEERAVRDEEKRLAIEEGIESVNKRLIEGLPPRDGSVECEWIADRGDYCIKGSELFISEIVEKLSAGQTVDQIAKDSGVPVSQVATVVHDLYGELIRNRSRNDALFEGLSSSINELTAYSKKFSYVPLLGLACVVIGAVLLVLSVGGRTR